MNSSARRRHLPLLLLAAALACAACDGPNRTLGGDLVVPPAAAGDSTPPVSSNSAEHPVTSPDGGQQKLPQRSASDDWITTRSTSALRAQPGLGGGIHVATRGGRVLLTGTVATAESSAQALSIVRAVDGVVQVDNQITVH